MSNLTNIKKIWEKEGKKILQGNNDSGSASALLENMEEYITFKTKTELQHLFEKVNFKNKTVLDIGCGPGRLSFEIAKRSKSVKGIDISSGFIDYANEIKSKLNYTNISFENISLQEMKSKIKFDIIFIGGVLLYLNDDEIIEFLKTIENDFIVNDGMIILREPISYTKTEYNDIDTKRTEEDFIKLFIISNFKLIYNRATFIHCPFYRPYLNINEKKRSKRIPRLVFRILFKINYFFDILIRKLGEGYENKVSSGWTIKQKYFFLKKN